MGKVTIAIPTLDRARYLSLAVASALAQTYRDVEIIVSNNASTDETGSFLDAITDPRVRVLHQTTRLTMVENWNACLRVATGSYFLLLSDDDLLDPEAIKALVAGFERADELDRVGMVYCRGRVIDQDGKIVRENRSSPAAEAAIPLILGFFQSVRDTWPCCILLRTADMTAGYSADFLVITDAAMWIHAVIRHGEARFVDRPLVSYRVHQNTTSKTPVAVWQKENNTLAAYTIAELDRAGLSTPSSTQAIHKEVAHLNVRIIPMLLNGGFRGRRVAAVGQYLRYLPQFLGQGEMANWIEQVTGQLGVWAIRSRLKRLRGNTQTS